MKEYKMTESGLEICSGVNRKKKKKSLDLFAWVHQANAQV